MGILVKVTSDSRFLGFGRPGCGGLSTPAGDIESTPAEDIESTPAGDIEINNDFSIFQSTLDNYPVFFVWWGRLYKNIQRHWQIEN